MKESLALALTAGKLFDVNEKTEYVETITGIFIAREKPNSNIREETSIYMHVFSLSPSFLFLKQPSASTNTSERDKTKRRSHPSIRDSR